jgi:hypothetical protein
MKEKPLELNISIALMSPCTLNISKSGFFSVEEATLPTQTSLTKTEGILWRLEEHG